MSRRRKAKPSGELDQETAESLIRRIHSDDRAEALSAVEEYSEITDDMELLLEDEDDAIAAVREALRGSAEMIQMLRERVVPVLRAGFHLVAEQGCGFIAQRADRPVASLRETPQQ